MSDEEAAIASATEGITATSEEIAALEAGIKALDSDGLMACPTTHLTVFAGIYKGIKNAILFAGLC